MIVFNLIGPGRLGLALAKALSHTRGFKLQAIYHPNITRAKLAQEKLKHGFACDDFKQLSDADITFITTPDGTIAGIARALVHEANLKPESLVVHLSGLCPLEQLKPLEAKGVYTACMHPLKAFRADSYLEAHPFENVDCAIEGDQPASKILLSLVDRLKAQAFEILPEQKTSYHTAAIMASNYLITLAAESIALLEKAGLNQDKAHGLCTRLMQTSLNNLKATQHPQDALTGPLARGDVETIQKHLENISCEKTQSLYQAAGHATLPLTKLDANTKKILEALLNKQ